MTSSDRDSEKPSPESPPKEETARRRDEVVKRMLKTPPKQRPKPEPGKKGRPIKGAEKIGSSTSSS